MKGMFVSLVFFAVDLATMGDGSSMEEQRPYKLQVVGSSPTHPTKSEAALRASPALTWPQPQAGRLSGAVASICGLPCDSDKKGGDNSGTSQVLRDGDHAAHGYSDGGRQMGSSRDADGKAESSEWRFRGEQEFLGRDPIWRDSSRRDQSGSMGVIRVGQGVLRGLQPSTVAAPSEEETHGQFPSPITNSSEDTPWEGLNILEDGTMLYLDPEFGATFRSMMEQEGGWDAGIVPIQINGVWYDQLGCMQLLWDSAMERNAAALGYGYDDLLDCPKNVQVAERWYHLTNDGTPWRKWSTKPRWRIEGHD